MKINFNSNFHLFLNLFLADRKVIRRKKSHAVHNFKGRNHMDFGEFHDPEERHF